MEENNKPEKIPKPDTIIHKLRIQNGMLNIFKNRYRPLNLFFL